MRVVALVVFAAALCSTAVHAQPLAGIDAVPQRLETAQRRLPTLESKTTVYPASKAK